MRVLPLKIALAVWLALSASGWVFGMVRLGGAYLPYPAVGAVLLLYAPWLVLLVVAADRWGQRRGAPAARPVAIALAALIAAALASYPYWAIPKERYFDAVLSSCQAEHGVATVTWEDVPAFDANVRIFRARTAVHRRLIACVNRRAGLLIDDLACRGGESRGGANAALEIASGNAHTLQQQRFFDVVRYDYPGAASVPLGSAEWCPWQRDL